MLDVLEMPAVRARVPALSVEMYHRMAELGASAPNVELIRGAIIEKIPKSPLHASIVTRLFGLVLRCVRAGYVVRSEQPLTLPDSEPEPDLAVVRGAEEDFDTAHPPSADLVMEVAVSSEVIDRLKMQLYAEAGVREFWLILARARLIERYTEPCGSAYARMEHVAFGTPLASTVFPELILSLP